MSDQTPQILAPLTPEQLTSLLHSRSPPLSPSDESPGVVSSPECDAEETDRFLSSPVREASYGSGDGEDISGKEHEFAQYVSEYISGLLPVCASPIQEEDTQSDRNESATEPEYALVRPLWREIREIEEKIIACKRAGLSREQVEKTKLEAWQAPGTEDMVEPMRVMKEALVDCYYAPANAKKRKRDESEVNDTSPQLDELEGLESMSVINPKRVFVSDSRIVMILK